MQIAIASGKGGTGKTTVALNLAYLAAQQGKTVQYLDCDVEEPNGHLFLKPKIEETRPVGVPMPEVDKSRCTGCGLCRDICQYNAITCFNKTVLVFPELCHGCGGCSLVCPENAITEKSRNIGIVEKGMAGTIQFVHGKLRIGEAMSPPLIREVKKEIHSEAVTFIDVPPGTSCPVITAIQGADLVILVTEPTPFGLNDLKLALEMVRELDLPFGVVVNRHDSDNESARVFCKENNTPVFAEIPDDRRVAEAYSIGKIAAETITEYEDHFKKLWHTIVKLLPEKK